MSRFVPKTAPEQKKPKIPLETESITVKFFNSHPDAVLDPSPPPEKLSDIETALSASQIDDLIHMS
jgi:hypothetical protein